MNKFFISAKSKAVIFFEMIRKIYQIPQKNVMLSTSNFYTVKLVCLCKNQIKVFY
jgi:hypothetical protein